MSCELTAADGARIAALAGLAPPLRLDDLPVTGTLNFAADGGKIGIDRLSLRIAGSPVKGQLALSAAGDRRRVEGNLDIGEVSLAKLLAPLLDQRLAVTATAEAAISGRQSPWPDEPFDAAVLDGFEGNIRLNSPRLVLADGLAIKDARVDVALEGGRIDVKQIEGAALGGRSRAAVRIDKVPGGVEIGGSLRIDGGKLEALAAVGGGSSRASGIVSGEITFSGKGTSPRNAISAVQGSGNFQLEDAKLPGLWPGAINSAVDAALKSDPDRVAATLRQALLAGLSARQLQLAGHHRRRNRRRAHSREALRRRGAGRPGHRQRQRRSQIPAVRVRLAARAESCLRPACPTSPPCRASRCSTAGRSRRSPRSSRTSSPSRSSASSACARWSATWRSWRS